MQRFLPSPSSRRHLGYLAALLLIGMSRSDSGVGAQQPGSQERPQPQVTFKSDVNYIEVPVVVVDRNGRFMPGLRQTDFEVREDGERQTISTFAVVNLEREHAGAPPSVQNGIASDVQTNATPFDGRLYVLLMDDLHVDAVNTPPTRQLARKFVETQVGPGDLAAIVCTGTCVGASQDFTPDHRLLFAAIDQFMGHKDPALGSLVLFPDRVTLSIIRDIANSLSAVDRRRKALVFLSEGFQLPFAVGEAGRDVAGAVSAATRANVSIYGVDPTGLSVDPSAESRLGVLRQLSTDTGGFAVVNRNDLGAGLDRIGQDTSRYYLLGYYPAKSKRDGKFHSLDVKVGVPDVEVRARAGYVAPRADASPSSEEAALVATKQSVPAAVHEVLDNPMPVPNLRFSAFAAPFVGTAGRSAVTIVVQVDGRDIRLSDPDRRIDGGLVLKVLATDSEGKVWNSWAKSIRLPLLAETRTHVAINGIRAVERLDLPHGRYRLRIAVQDVESKRVGSVHYDLAVPDFGALPFSMSGLVLTSTLAGKIPSTPSEHLATFRPYLPGPPTATRTFQNSEALALTAQIYDRQTAPHPVDIVASVRNEVGVEVYRRESQQAVGDVAAGRRGYRYATTVSLAALTPGSYVLTVEARSRVNPERTARREVPFRIATPDGDARR